VSVSFSCVYDGIGSSQSFSPRQTGADTHTITIKTREASTHINNARVNDGRGRLAGLWIED